MIIPLLEKIELGELSRQDIKFYNTAKGGVFDAQNRIKFEYTLRDHLYEAYFEDIDIWYELVKYHDWEIINYEANEELDSLEIFMKKFTKFINKNRQRLNRIWYALFAEYDPTENVFEYEHETTEKDGTVDHIGGIVVTYQNGKVLTKVKGQQSDTYTDNSSTTTNYATAFDTTSELEKDKSVKSGGYTMQHGQGTDTETASGTDTESKSGTDTDEYDTTDTRNFDKHGNIGVMKTQDMINAELKLRAHDLVSILVKDFVTETGYVHLSLEDLGYAD